MDIAQRVADAVNLGIGFGILLAVYFFLSHRSKDGGATRWQRWISYFVMSRGEKNSGAGGASTDARVGAGGAGDLVRAQQHQVNDDIDSEIAPEREPFALRQLPKTELIVLLAVQRKEDGNYLWSANDITKFYPGADGPIKEIIATVRGKKPVEPAARSIRKGVGGEWEPAR